jgi:hypothetical protein
VLTGGDKERCGNSESAMQWSDIGYNTKMVVHVNTSVEHENGE